MTNKEYIEKNNISFAEAMNMWDEKNYPCINDWLKADMIECPFKVGDFLRNRHYEDAICVVIDIKDYMYFRMINRDGTFTKLPFDGSFGRDYHSEDYTVFAYPIDKCANAFEKIY